VDAPLSLRRYAFRFVYTDGTVLEEIDRFGRLLKSTDIDWGRCCRVDLVPQVAGLPPVSMLIKVERGERGTKFWLRDSSMNTGELVEDKAVLGLLQKTVGGEVLSTFLLCQADGRIVLSSSEDY